jgi:hypothetical protein
MDSKFISTSDFEIEPFLMGRHLGVPTSQNSNPRVSDQDRFAEALFDSLAISDNQSAQNLILLIQTLYTGTISVTDFKVSVPSTNIQQSRTLK